MFSKSSCYERHREQHLSQFEKQVAPEMLARPKVRKILETLGLDVFVPQNWDGVNGLPDLELEFLPTFPSSSKPGARPVNPRLYEHAKKEYTRLKKYMYEKSYSAVASPLVIAPKATAPFIRFCGDYVKINKHIVTHHYPIPKVTNELAKISRWTHFLDVDMANSFHQRKLGPITSERLSIQSPWGLDRPKFMPEGIGPASGYLQEMVEDIFRGFEDFTITIFDNFLVCCDWCNLFSTIATIPKPELSRSLHTSDQPTRPTTVCLRAFQTPSVRLNSCASSTTTSPPS